MYEINKTYETAAENVADSVKRRWGKTNDLTLT